MYHKGRYATLVPAAALVTKSYDSPGQNLVGDFG